ncbi:hypothetical protein BY996DRAFT_950088 [Phakopsora pachyrhizi]|uniref:Uncharacterized protein n=1 Tax=Phakopsora pachyrhizi TaxID=170000 RepID=A0AAV0BSV9_PHAPC|nr:hypothetical protein BY996DRAFT_950088 [Phakopsora pachyrhizi]CAH7682170.1 hypothetical protein PPACK8108_LOCUS14916 [Phakopsora pachyrhizi]CAH7689748.1 hypothetical protein PPACK8108_LOCUS24883 [Phakopsora pachyrhizi]
MEDELQRLWQILAELSSQLTQNREQCENLKKQAEDLKTQAIHTGTGYALKRFNVDLSKEQFESEVERMNAQLVVENQTLQHENRQLTILLKDYETTLEQIMNRFRTHAHSTQQHEIDLTKYYESVLYQVLEKQNLNNNSLTTTTTMNYNFDGEVHYEMDPNTFQVIRNISILVQKAMRELSGEEPYLDENDELVEQQQEQLQQQQQQQPPDPSPSHSPIEAKDVQTDHDRLNPKVVFQDPFDVNQKIQSQDQKQEQRRNSTSAVEFQRRIRDPSTGGFVGKRNGSLSDQALLNAIEMERLKKENEYLRELLGISGDFDHQNGSSNESSSLRTRGKDSNGVGGAEGAARDDEHELHLAKLNSVVSEVIKEEEEEEEEEEEDDDDDEHLEEQHEGPYYVDEEEHIKAWQTAPREVDQDEHGEISNKHGDANDQTHLDQDLSPLSSSHDQNFENNQPNSSGYS